MRFHFLQACYARVDRRRNSTKKGEVHSRMLFTPKPFLFGLRLLLHWGDLTEDSFFELGLQGMRVNSKVDLVLLVNSPKVTSYLRACKINISNLHIAARANAYSWFPREEDRAVVMEVAHVAPLLLRTLFLETFYKEYRHVQEAHNRDPRYPVRFAHTYSQKAPAHAGIEGGHQGPGSGV